ncbi:hypothetical protein [Piscinibacter sakaiensis]|uniref:hypothetical protein n=1 Tax=Piscinibacter sakaiensis TaxID=1547922 RepID=UPI003AAC8620
MRRWACLKLMVFAGISSGCSPTFDWREARPADRMVALFPCRPQSAVRTVVLASQRVEMKMMSCEAGGAAFAVSRIDVDDPERIEPLLQAMRSALVANLAANTPAEADRGGPRVGVTASSGRWGGQHLDVLGRGPQGQPIHAQGEFFSHQGSVYQASVVGRKLDPDATDFFFASLQLR